MNCRAANRLYVRANGSIPCNCDVGEAVTLFAPDTSTPDEFSYVRDCYNGEPFLRMRNSFLNGSEFLACCKNCFFFRPNEKFEFFGTAGKLDCIENLQVESSFLCTVDCEACVPKAIRTDPERSPLGEGPYNLPVDVFKKMIDDLRADDIKVAEFFFCGRGEPLLHPRFGELIRYARQSYPGSVYAAHTNGNLKFHTGALELDDLVVSIDGAYQESYATYRRGSSIDRVFRFVKDVLEQREAYVSGKSSGKKKSVRAAGPEGKKPPNLRWKYILFEHNDSDQEIRDAQQLALDMGVDEMLFCLSHTWNRSKKYTTVEQIEANPIFHIFNKNTVFYSSVNPDVKNIDQWEEEGERRGFK